MANLFPRLSLLGTLGVQSATLKRLPDPQSIFFNFIGQILTPIFDAGRIGSNICAAQARYEIARANYYQAVFTALEETRNALSNYANERERSRRLEEALGSSKKNLDLAMTLYTNGLTDFTTVLLAQQSLNSVDDQLADSRTLVITSAVALYKALGGGWESVYCDGNLCGECLSFEEGGLPNATLSELPCCP
jgi:multidrug efflux system outer membrane protein